MNRWVDISFDCLPLRSVTRLDIPLDASPKFRAKCERIKQAIETHGTHNTYYLHQAHCAFHLTNDPNVGMVRFFFEGTIFTDHTDARAEHAHLTVTLDGETCEWLTPSDLEFLSRSVTPAVLVENGTRADERRVVGEAEVVVGAEVEHGAAVGEGDVRLLRRGDHPLVLVQALGAQGVGAQGEVAE